MQVERQWGEVNDVLEKYHIEWKWLERQGLMVGGRRADPLDLFCLTRVYLPYIRRDVDRHFMAMAHRTKARSTRNPHYPQGSYLPIERLLGSDDEHSLPVSEEQVDLMDDFKLSRATTTRTTRSPRRPGRWTPCRRTRSARSATGSSRVDEPDVRGGDVRRVPRRDAVHPSAVRRILLNVLRGVEGRR